MVTRGSEKELECSKKRQVEPWKTEQMLIGGRKAKEPMMFGGYASNIGLRRWSEGRKSGVWRTSL